MTVRVHIQLGTTNLVMTVETAVNAVIFAVIGDIQRREHLHRVAEMLARFRLCALCHLFKERQRRGRQQCAEVLRRENVLAKRMVPRNWVNKDGSYVTQEFVNYVEPLIQGDYQPFMVNGLPQHLVLKR